MEYGLIGGALTHSYSKQIHELLADYTYDLRPLSKEEFPDFMKVHNFKAINVTIPYKCDVIPYLTQMDEHAVSIGAVNTVINKNGSLFGYNTDYSGFLYTVKKNHVTLEGKKVLVLGKGGASKAVLAVLKDQMAREIHIVYKNRFPGTITYQECLSDHTDTDIIINTTPVGMYPHTEDIPIDLSPFSGLSAVFDLIYNPFQTQLLKQAKELGILAVNGLEMLVAQAKEAAELFLNSSIEDEKIDQIVKTLAAEKTKETNLT